MTSLIDWSFRKVSRLGRSPERRWNIQIGPQHAKHSINKTEDCLHMHRKTSEAETLERCILQKQQWSRRVPHFTPLSIVLIIKLEINLTFKFQNMIAMTWRINANWNNHAVTPLRRSQEMLVAALSCHQVGIKHNNSAWTLKWLFFALVTHQKHWFYSIFLCETACLPSRNPLRNFLRTTFKCLIRPVPVVLRLLALTLHPYPRIRAWGNPQGAQTFFWMWKATLPHRRQSVCVLLRLLPNELVPLVCNSQMNVN